MPDNIFPFLIVAIILAAILYNFFFSKKARINRKLRKAPFRKIANFQNGEIAKIIGNILPIDQALRAPLSLRECSYYYVLVEEKRSNGKSSHWRTIIEQEISNKFLVKEGENVALIQDHRVMSNIVIDKKYSSGLFNDASERLESFLKKHGYESEGFLGFNKEIRYKEGILEDNEKVSVLGKGEWKTAIELGLPPEYEKILVITAADNEHIYLSDDPETTEVNTVKPKRMQRSRYNKSYRK